MYTAVRKHQGYIVHHSLEQGPGMLLIQADFMQGRCCATAVTDVVHQDGVFTCRPGARHVATGFV